MKSVTKIIMAVIVIAIVGYAAVMYPRPAMSLPISLTAGVESKNLEFDVPALHEKAQVLIDVQSGLAAWSATISSGNNILWNNQGSGDYLGDWIKLPTGHYMFTFITLGGALEAKVNIVTKGGIW